MELSQSSLAKETHASQTPPLPWGQSRSQLTSNTHLVPPRSPVPSASHPALLTSAVALWREQSLGSSTVKSGTEQRGPWGKLPNLSELQRPRWENGAILTRLPYACPGLSQTRQASITLSGRFSGAVPLGYQNGGTQRIPEQAIHWPEEGAAGSYTLSP